MTTNQVQANAATSPFVSGLQVDAWGAVLSTDANLTEQQRPIVLSTSIPLVFAKEIAGDGGAWITPPAARYGAQSNVTTGVTVSMGLVLSDGQIGAVAIADVYKGAAKLSALTSPTATFSFGSMPTSGFDYTLTTTTTATASDFLAVPITSSYNIVRNGCMSFVAVNVRVTQGATTYFKGYDLYVNGVIVEGTSLTSVYDTAGINISRTFTTPTDVVLRIYQYPTTPYPSGAQVLGEITHTYLSTAPATQQTSDFPIFGGSGGTFSGLSCLSIKANYPLTGGITTEGDVNGEAFSRTGTNAFSITKNSTKKIVVTNMTVKSGGVNQFFTWAVYGNNVLIENNGGSFITTWNYTRTFAVNTNVRLDISPLSSWPAGSVATCTLDYTALTTQGAESPLTYSDQVRCFVRNGVQIFNLLTSTTQSTSNFADIAYYLLNQVAGIPAALIDTAAMTTAATFTNINQLFFNGAINSQSNLRSYLQALASYFLLRFTQIDGKFALVPLLPANADGTFKTTAITPVKEFTNAMIIEGSYSREYIPAADRRESAALVAWRNQSTSDYSVISTAEVRYTGTAANGPFNKFEASEFCASYNHAVLIGKYALATKKHITHSISFDTTIEDGDTIKSLDIIGVIWSATPTIGSPLTARILYQVESVTDQGDGTVSVDALHFPSNGSDQSLIALDLVGSGYQIQ